MKGKRLRKRSLKGHVWFDSGEIDFIDGFKFSKLISFNDVFYDTVDIAGTKKRFLI